MKLESLFRHSVMFAALFVAHSASALPFSIVPDLSIPFPTTMVAGTTVSATYTVTNNTGITRNGNYVKYLPPNVSILSTGCGEKFNLAARGQPGDSCSLNLTISGEVEANDPDIRHHLFICFPGGISCAGTKFPLDVSVLSDIGVSGINALSHADTKVFAGGLNSSNKGNMWAFAASTWSTIYNGAPSSPVEAITTLANAPIYFGGQVYNSGQFYSAWIYQYNPDTAVTTDTGFMAATNATKLNSLSMSNTTVYAGGIDNTGIQGQAWAYTIGDASWASLGLADTNITEVMSVLYSPVQTYVFAAWTNNGSATTSHNPYAQVQYYNGTAWQDTGLPNSDAGLYLATVNALAADNVGTIYAGGIDSNQHAAVWRYAGGTWTPLAAPSVLAQGEIYALAFNNDNVLFAGGFDGSIGQVWYYNTGSAAWTSMNLTGSTLVESMTINSANVLYAGGLAANNNSGIWSMSARVS